MNTIEAEPLFQPPTAEMRFLPEGPYPAGDGQMSWVAIQHGADATTGSLNLFDFETKKNQQHALPGRPGFAFPTTREGTFVVGLERHVGLFELATGKFTPLTEEIDAGVSNTIINDGVCFSAGIVFGCKDLEFKTPKAGLYFWRASDQKLFPLRNDQTCSNGKIIGRSGDEFELLDIDTPTKQVRRYRLDPISGSLSEAEIALDLTKVDAFPDGMIATPDGSGVIISFYNPTDVEAGETRQYRLEDGELETAWKTPFSPRNTCPQLLRVGNQVKLVITTAVEDMSAAQLAKHTRAGWLFVADTDFSDLPDTPTLEI